MTLTTQQISTAAGDLYQAEQSREQIGLLSLRHPGLDMAGAYAIQAALVDRKLAAGRTVIGWKIGLTSKAMQDALGINIPDSGVLFDDMLFANGAMVPQGRYIQPRIEAEIAFVMQAPLSGVETSRQDVLDATDYVSPSLEILDTRIERKDPATGESRSIFDTISDNAANAGIVLSTERHPVAGPDLRWVGAIVARNGIVEETGLGAGVLNDPVAGIVWLVRRLAQYGQSIRAGDIVLSGSFVRPVEAPGGSEISADFGAFGKVECRFE